MLVLEKLYKSYDAYVFLRYPQTRVQVEDKVVAEDEDPLEGTTEDAEVLEKSFYEADLRWCQIPYGPFWDADCIERVIQRKVEINSVGSL